MPAPLAQRQASWELRQTTGSSVASWPPPPRKAAAALKTQTRGSKAAESSKAVRVHGY